MDVAANLAAVRDRMERARSRAGREDPVTLIAVTKGVSPENVRVACDAGQRVFGENRVQEGAEKREAVHQGTWHLVGHLQTNKVRTAVQTFDLVQSVDSLRLAQRLHGVSLMRGSRLPVLLEVNVAGEASKSGFSPASLEEAAPELLKLGALDLQGLMTVAPLAPDPADVRWVFRELRLLRDRLAATFAMDGLSQLSMGMTADFEVAIQEGATMVRIGRAIFGERPPLHR